MMKKHDSEWFRQRAIEKRRQNDERQKQINEQVRRDMDDLEKLKRQLLKEAKRDRKSC